MKKIIGILAFVVLIIVVVFIGYKLKNPSYKSIAKEFSSACDSKEKMEKFVDKRFDVKAICAIRKVSIQEDKQALEKAFKDEYKKVSNEEIEATKKELRELMFEFVSEDDEVIFKSIDEPVEDDKIPFLKVADAVYEIGEDTADVEFYFYNNKVILIDIDAVYNEKEFDNDSEQVVIESDE